MKPWITIDAVARCASMGAAIWTMALCPSTRASAQDVLAPHAQKAPRDTLALAAAAISDRQCLGELTALSAPSIEGTSNNDVLFDWDHRRMGNGPVYALLGLNHPNDGEALSISATPEADGSCSVAAERISVEASSCKAVAHRELPGYRATPLLAHMTVYTSASDASSSVSLIDTPPGCLVIRRYVKFSAASAPVTVTR